MIRGPDFFVLAFSHFYHSFTKYTILFLSHVTQIQAHRHNESCVANDILEMLGKLRCQVNVHSIICLWLNIFNINLFKRGYYLNTSQIWGNLLNIFTDTLRISSMFIYLKNIIVGSPLNVQCLILLMKTKVKWTKTIERSLIFL